MTAGWCARTVRAAVFAAVCVVLAALGHVMMSGDHVPLPVLAAGWAATGAAGWCLAGRERGPGVVVAVAVAVQTALHSAFSLAPQGPGTPAGGARTADPHALHVGMDMGMGAGAGTGSTHHGLGALGHAGHGTGGDASLGMLAAHLLAALLCGLWLAHGERAAFRLLRAVGARLAAPLRLLFARPVPPPPPPVRVRRRSSDRRPRLLLLVHAITSRGPPVGTAAA
ncbi:hypothetical protein ACFC5X_31085 [Streptomyces sp. NPDC055952]|uniref:hypothetical protein n=1 Tax=Streptomyces sp. NPDC055952 TaxID=3345663 RepID=UPI0035E25FF7